MIRCKLGCLKMAHARLLVTVICLVRLTSSAESIGFTWSNSKAFELRREIWSECHYFKSKTMKASCFRIARNPSTVKIRGLVRDKGLPTVTPKIENNNLSISPNHSLKIQDWQRGANSSLGCYSHLHCGEDIPESVTNENYRSSSPWDYCEHYDPKRQGYKCIISSLRWRLALGAMGGVCMIGEK